MFARPNKKKDEQKKRPTVQKPNKKPSLPNQRQRTSIQPSSMTINKIASIRTLPPFAYINSDSGNNSQEYSDTHTQIWREQYQLFETDHQDTIKDLDKQLQDVLETIKKERNLIDMKIWKLKSKFQQNYDRTSRRSISRIIVTPKSDIATTTNENEVELVTSQFGKKQQQTQFPEPVYFSNYFKELASSLGLASYQECREQGEQKIEDEVKIQENKIILDMLFEKISKN